MAKAYLEKILTDLEKVEVEKFAGNEVMVEAVRKVLLAGLYANGTLRQGLNADPLANAAFLLVAYKKEQKLSNEEIGADLTALWEGINALEAGLSALKEFAPKKAEDKQKENPGR